MNIPDWFYGVASIAAAVAMGFLMVKKRQQGVKDDLYSTVGKVIIILFMAAFGVLLLKVGKA